MFSFIASLGGHVLHSPQEGGHVLQTLFPKNQVTGGCHISSVSALLLVFFSTAFGVALSNGTPAVYPGVLTPQSLC